MPLSSEPINYNILAGNNHRLVFSRLKSMTYFCQKVNLPGLTVGDSIQPTRFQNLAWSDIKIQWSPLRVDFMVDEELANWLEVQRWMRSTTVTDSHESYDPAGLYSDGTLMILTNNRQANIEATFTNLRPTSLSDLEFDSTNDSVTPVTATATFVYQSVSYKLLKGSYESQQNT